MRRLIFLTLVVCLFNSGLAVAAILRGRQQPKSELLALLRLSDCPRPCWIGITPGVTKFDEVEGLLKKTFAAPNYQIKLAEQSAADEEVRYYVFMDERPLFTVGFWRDSEGDIDSSIVASITIYFGIWADAIYGNPQFFEFYEILGAPQFLEVIELNQPKDYLNGPLHYSLAEGYVSIYTAEYEGEVQFPSKLVRTLVLSASRDKPWLNMGVVKWRGFFSNRAYIADFCSKITCR